MNATAKGTDDSGTAPTLLSGRRAYADQLRNHDAYWYFSAVTFSLRSALLSAIGSYCSGRVLDAGAGGLHGKRLLMPKCAEYVSVDISDQHGELDLVADVQNLEGIADHSFDTVFCNQVLEHIPDPRSALAEFRRVLRPGGTLLLAAPHLSALHEEPHDYYRYTQHGLRHLLETSGFDVLLVQRCGGLLAFLSHPFSYVINSVGWRIPVFRWVFWGLNLIALVVPATVLDYLLGTTRRWPVNIVAVGRRRDDR